MKPVALERVGLGADDDDEIREGDAVVPVRRDPSVPSVLSSCISSSSHSDSVRRGVAEREEK